MPSDFGHNLTAIHAQIEAFLEHNDSIRSDISLTMDSLSGNHLLTNDRNDMHKQRLENARDESEAKHGAFERDARNSSQLAAAGNRESNFQHSIDNGLKSPRVKHGNNGEAELTEQFEPGVYITYIQLSSGIKIFKRVRFR